MVLSAHLGLQQSGNKRALDPRQQTKAGSLLLLAVCAYAVAGLLQVGETERLQLLQRIHIIPVDSMSIPDGVRGPGEGHQLEAISFLHQVAPLLAQLVLHHTRSVIEMVIA